MTLYAKCKAFTLADTYSLTYIECNGLAIRVANIPMPYFQFSLPVTEARIPADRES